MKTIFSSLLAASVLALAGCGPATGSDSPANDTSQLDEMAKTDPQSAEFVGRVKLFYQALEKKDWPTSYDMRTATFKHDVTREYYLRQMAEGGQALDSYKVLSGHMYGGTNHDLTAAELIMEFNPGGGGVHSYSCARWIKRGGNWMETLSYQTSVTADAAR